MDTIALLLGIGCWGAAFWGHETGRLELLALVPAGVGLVLYAAAHLK